MRLDDCDLCQMKPVVSGREELLYEDLFCYIVENHNLAIDIDNNIKYASGRKCLVLKDHKRNLSFYEEQIVHMKLKAFMSENFDLEEGKDYFMRTTMRTFSDHYHTHAILYPLTNEPQK